MSRGPCRLRRPRVAVSFDRRWGRTPKPIPSSVPSPRQSDQAWWSCGSRLTLAVAGLGPGWLARMSVGRPRHVPGPGPGWLVPSPTSGRQFRPSLGPAAQARTILWRRTETAPTPRLATAARLGNYYAEGISKTKKPSTEAVPKIIRPYKNPAFQRDQNLRCMLGLSLHLSFLSRPLNPGERSPPGG